MAYTAPTPAELKALYPAFAAVSDATVQAWLDRVTGRDVDESWREADYAPAIIAAAAHRMVENGVPGITGAATGAYAAAGVTSFKSGSFNVSFDESAVQRISAGGWRSTSYGRDYLDLLAKNKSGGGVTSIGCACA